MLRFKYLFKDEFNWQNIEFLKNTRNHPEIMKTRFHNRKLTRIDQEDWFYNTYSPDLNYKIWIAYSEEKSCPVGYIQYKIDSLVHRRCQVKYAIAPEFSGCGYGKKIVKWSVDNVKTWEDEIHRLWATFLTDDEVIMESLSACGFEVDGVLRDYVYKDGVYRDVYVMSILIN
jgi:RimJ/RimL family protein N-acetyltransferase